jgi:hypothetical protein
MICYRALFIVLTVTSTSSWGFSQTQAGGLDSLTDDPVYTELSRRNLNSLLDYVFEKNNIPESKQKAIRAGGALARLQNDSDLSLADRRKLVAEFVNALPTLLPEINDPAALLLNANLLIQHGILTDQRLLEYFGPNSTIMARLNPVAEAAQSILLKANQMALAGAEKAAENWPAGKAAWERYDQLATTAEYTRNILSYAVALSLDKASENRARLIQEAIDYLSAFDTEDNPGRASVKFYLGKLYLAQSTPESLTKSREMFDFVLTNGDPNDIGNQYDSRVAIVLTAIAAKDFAAAEQAIQAFESWVKSNNIVQNNPAAEAEFKAAVGGLRYRTLLAQNKTTQADQVLDSLQQEVPSLRGLILELMAANIKPDTPVRELNSLLLQSLRAKAEAEVLKPENTPFDAQSVQRGIDAASELIRRGGQENPSVVQDSLYVLGFLYQKLGNQFQAADAFLDYAEKYKDKSEDLERANIALNNAIVLVGQLYRTRTGEREVTAIYDRTLDLAVAKPFERTQFAFERGRRQQARGNLDQAIQMYDLVKPTDRQYDEAQYFKMVAIRSKLDKLPARDRSRSDLLRELQSLADRVNQAFESKLSSADPETTRLIRIRLAQTRLVAADVALVDQKDPNRALQLLEGFEQTVAGLPNADNLISQVLLIRVKSYVQTNQVEKGVQQIQALADQRPREAMQIIFDLMDKLNEQVVNAESAGRRDEIANLERTRAELTPVLVKLIDQSNNPELKKFQYQIALYDADQQRRAAELTENPDRRKSLLQAALKRFEQLDSREQFAQYIESLPKDRQDRARRIGYDPQVKLGLARTHFALGNWDAARQPLAVLFRDKVLGDGIVVKFGPDGTPENVDNPTYWEAVFMLMRSNLALNEGIDAMKTWLTTLTNTWKSDLGGQRWSEAFRQLQTDLGVQPVSETGPDNPSA